MSADLRACRMPRAPAEVSSSGFRVARVRVQAVSDYCAKAGGTAHLRRGRHPLTAGSWTVALTPPARSMGSVVRAGPLIPYSQQVGIKLAGSRQPATGHLATGALI
jgi:hypothetical protein